MPAQCVQFDQYQLQQNLYKLKGRTLNLSMDRQHFYSNWSDKSDARRTKIVNVTTIDNSSRFALASTLNFDFTSDYNYLKKEFIRIGEYLKPSHKRRYPQCISKQLKELIPTDSIMYDKLKAIEASNNSVIDIRDLEVCETLILEYRSRGY